MNIKELRQKINKIDTEILQLINERINLALDIGRIKTRKKEEYYVPSREKEVYERLIKKNKGPLPSRSVKAIYREIMSAALSLENPVKVVYLGPKVTFTHQAALEKFGSSVALLPVKSIAEVFMEVEKGRADYGVVPIENSTEGVVNYTLDMFVDSELQICSEISLEISHYLLSRDKLEDIERIYSNYQALGQCRNWVESHLPRAELIEVSATSKGAELAAREKGGAAIASELAAEAYNLRIVGQRIEDSASNVTRFLVIGKTFAAPSGQDKTSLMFSIKDQVGALYAILQPFKKQGINLTKVESRPSRRKAWDYYFFVDLKGHYQDERVKKAIGELEKECRFLKVLGSYPAGEIRVNANTKNLPMELAP
ncbi:prephenate dehydratase [candidate division NPL-UPA2 bacterium]|nr:prephenate dehydratase [candidate division NPL-UPA2 bacterium]